MAPKSGRSMEPGDMKQDAIDRRMHEKCRWRKKKKKKLKMWLLVKLKMDFHGNCHKMIWFVQKLTFHVFVLLLQWLWEYAIWIWYWKLTINTSINHWKLTKFDRDPNLWMVIILLIWPGHTLQHFPGIRIGLSQSSNGHSFDRLRHFIWPMIRSFLVT